MYPKDYLYSEQHEWLRVDEDVCVLGITAFAQSELGEVVYVDLPEVGEMLEAEEEIGSIESVKAVAEVYTPVAGEVIEINEALEDEPERVNEDPHGKGWLVKLRITSQDALEGLMNAAAYEEFLNSAEDG